MTAAPGADVPATIGVVGAGTMGAGIAQLGCAAGLRVLLHDADPGALDRGARRVTDGLARDAARDRAAPGAAELLRPVAALDALAPCELVIEAAPERLELKRELIARVSAICEHAVLATNTSSIPVTALAAAARRPADVVGMHFFNPAPVMRLVEVVAAEQTGPRALAVARATGEAMGKRVLVVADGPGFLVNRCARPVGAEALRLVQERIATPDQVDRVCRMGGGFPMGPFELMDLVGNDTSLAVASSFAELSFGEPRWRPSPLQAQLVAAGRLGRKTGHGWYRYGERADLAPDPEPPPRGGGEGRHVAVLGDSRLASALRARAREAGFEVHEVRPSGEAGLEVHAPRPSGRDPVELVVDAADPAGKRTGAVATGTARPGAAGMADVGPGEPPVALLCATASLVARRQPDACGFNLVPPLGGARLVELTRTATTPAPVALAAERFFAALGFHPEWVGDAPGLVLGRIVLQLVNEAAFAIGEGIGDPADIDAGLVLGLRHPRGPVAWGEAIGPDAVLAGLDGLWEERREERYRAAPLLRRAVALGAPLSG